MLISTFFVLFVLALGVQSEIQKIFQEEVPGHEGECLGRNGKFYKLGEPMADDGEKCARKICKGAIQPGTIHIDVDSCPTVSGKSGCTIKSDNKENFPDCCARLVCKQQ